MEIAFGIFDHMERGEVPLEQLYAERLRLLAAADEAGFYCYHLAEHHSTPLGCAPSPGVFLAALATRTRRIHLGPLVYLLPLYNPLRLVEEICMLDQLSGGRFEIGVGRGISPFELGHFNVHFMESRSIFEEALEVIVAGLRNRTLTHRGEHYRFSGAPIEIAPKQQPNPPFWYGAGTPDSVAFAARHGMQMVTGGNNAIVKANVHSYRELYEENRATSTNLSPQIEIPRAGAVRHLYVAESDQQAEAVAVSAYRVYYRNITKLWRDFGVAPLLFTEDLQRARAADAAIVGSPATVREKIAAYFDQTASNYLVLSFAWGSLTYSSRAAHWTCSPPK